MCLNHCQFTSSCFFFFFNSPDDLNNSLFPEFDLILGENFIDETVKFCSTLVSVNCL